MSAHINSPTVPHDDLQPARWETIVSILATVLFAVWFSWPLWTAQTGAYMRTAGDESLVSPWFYDLVARQIREYQTLDQLAGFGWPTPDDRHPWFPNVSDAILTAPVAWIFDWPRQWNIVLALSVLVDGLGAYVLAQAAGLRPWARLMSACLVVMSPMSWKERVLARPNAMYLGVALAAAGGTLIAWRRSDLRWAVTAGCLGALAVSVYPPWLLFLLPIAMVLAPWESPPSGRAALRIAVTVGAVLASPALHEIISSRLVYVNVSADKFLVCPDALHAVAWKRMARIVPAIDGGPVHAWMPGVGWVGAFFGACFAPRRFAVGLLGVAVVFATLSSGPCPGVDDVGAVLGTPRAWHAALRATRVAFTDFGRFAAVSWVATSILAGFALEGASRELRPLAAACMLTACAWVVRPELVGLSRWTTLGAPSYAEWLAKAPPGPVAELPFGPHQFLSVLVDPSRPRVNPLLFDRAAPSGNVVVDWLRRLGVGDVPETAPTPAEMAHSGVRWVVVDPAPCERRMRAPLPPEACDGRIARTLEGLLGPPHESFEGGAGAWDLTRTK